MLPSSHSEKRMLLKMVLVGLAQAGKTALVEQFIEKKFSEDYIATLGTDFKVKKLDANENIPVALQIWDTSGQERFQSLGTAFYKGADVFVICVSPDDTADKVIKFLQDNVFPYIDNEENPLFVVVATKSDDKKYQTADSQTKLDSIIQYLGKEEFTNIFSETVVTSAKTGENVDKLFKSIVEELVKQQLKQEQQAAEYKSHYEPASNQAVSTPSRSKISILLVGAWQHLKRNPKRYALGLVLALGVAVLLTIPGIGQVLGLAGAMGYLVASTPLQLGLLTAGIAVCAFLAAVLGGYTIDKIKQRRQANKDYKLLSQFANSSVVDPNTGSSKIPTPLILQQSNTSNPTGAFSNSVSTTSATQTTTSSNSNYNQ